MASESPTILEAHDLKLRFGGLRALDGISLRVPRGALMGIIGPNGAGKSTLFNCLAGFLPPDDGRVLLEGRDVTRLRVHQRARLGLARTFQITRPLARLSVEENLRLAAKGQLGEHLWAALLARTKVAAEERALGARVDEMLRLFELEALREEYAGVLSGGQKKLLELARALMTEPRLVLLDEPMAGINPTLARKLLEKIEYLRREERLTFVFVEHDMETVFAHCDPILVMANGKRLAEGSAAEIRANPEVVEAYLGA